MSSEVLEVLRPLWREFGVERAWLFGGRARGKAGADSDWDFLVEFSGSPGFWRGSKRSWLMSSELEIAGRLLEGMQAGADCLSGFGR